MYQDIKDRTFKFALRIITLVEQAPESRSGRVLANQVLRSGTSIGANVEEATAAYSKADFVYKLSIALKEARETHYWLRLLEESRLIKQAHLADLLNECEEIKKVLGSIVSKVRGKNKAKNDNAD